MLEARARRAALGVLLALAAVPFAAEPATPDPRETVNLATFDEAWRLVRDTHFDPRLEGVDWEAVRDELRPAAREAADDEALRRVLEEMVARLRLSHFELIAGDAWSSGPARGYVSRHAELAEGCTADAYGRLIALVDPAGGSDATPGLELDLVDDELLVTRVERGAAAAQAGVRPGWRLISAGEVAADPLLACIDGLENVSFRGQLLRAAVSNLVQGPSGSVLPMVFETGDGSSREVRLERRPPPGEVVRFGHLPPTRARFELDWATTPAGARVAVVRFNIWLLPIPRAFDEAMDEMRTADGVVIDLRGNPGGIAAIAQGLAGHFLDQRLSLGALITRRSSLELVANPRLVTRDGRSVRPYSGPLAILVDGGTGSTSEVFAAGLHDLGRARLFGTPSAGAALPAVMDRLPNGDIFLHATMDYLRPAGGRVEGSPIVPDERVEVTREDLLEGRDPPLVAALAWIDRRRTTGGDGGDLSRERTCH